MVDKLSRHLLLQLSSVSLPIFS